MTPLIMKFRKTFWYCGCFDDVIIVPGGTISFLWYTFPADDDDIYVNVYNDMYVIFTQHIHQTCLQCNHVMPRDAI